jgi:hypothetical protein
MGVTPTIFNDPHEFMTQYARERVIPHRQLQIGRAYTSPGDPYKGFTHLRFWDWAVIAKRKSLVF